MSGVKIEFAVDYQENSKYVTDQRVFKIAEWSMLRFLIIPR